MSKCHNVIHGTAFCFSFLCRSGTLSDTTQPLLQDTFLEVSSSTLQQGIWHTAYGIRHIARTMAQKWWHFHCIVAMKRSLIHHLVWNQLLAPMITRICNSGTWLLIMVTETLLVEWTNFLLLFNWVWVSEPLLQDSLAWLSLVALRIHRLP
jgi:hypothetical protein